MSRILIENGPYAGWSSWSFEPEGRFAELLGPLYFRHENGSTECRMETAQRHANRIDTLHGGFLMAFIDMALFAIAEPSIGAVKNALTLTCNTEFFGAGRVGDPVAAHGEMLRETRRLIFVRGLVRQNGEPICAFSATLRKLNAK